MYHKIVIESPLSLNFLQSLEILILRQQKQTKVSHRLETTQMSLGKHRDLLLISAAATTEHTEVMSFGD